ncbi:mitochondrial-processing peptidase subunit beta [Acrasis kona]|uniref:Mitochondrial-processing peptidase subunit beta n=1 Tax=Acrasis kona TaxID=1008807 RepID=A0AAW2Z3X4_9EUKA
MSDKEDKVDAFDFLSECDSDSLKDENDDDDEIFQLIEVEFNKNDLDRATITNSIEQFNTKNHIEEFTLDQSKLNNERSSKNTCDAEQVLKCIKRSCYVMNQSKLPPHKSRAEMDYNRIGSERRDKDNEWKSFGTDIKKLVIGDWSPKHLYHGQHRLKVDVFQKSLIYNIYEYVLSSPTLLGLPDNAMSDPDEIMDTLDDFKLSRNLKIEVPTSHITSLRFQKLDNQHTVLVIDIKDAPNFYNRRICTQASLRNKFRPRMDFTPNFAASTSTRHFIVADSASLDHTIGVLLLLENFKSRIDAHPLHLKPTYLDKDKSLMKQKTLLEGSKSKKPLLTLKEDMITLLKNHDLDVSDDENKCLKYVLLIYLTTDSIRDAACRIPITQMEAVLKSTLHPDCCGKECTVEEIIRKKHCPSCSSIEYSYSFCFNELMCPSKIIHCPKCRECKDWRYWHCEACDNCSYGMSVPICECCGARKGSFRREGKTKLEPSSMFDQQNPFDCDYNAGSEDVQDHDEESDLESCDSDFDSLIQVGLKHLEEFAYRIVGMLPSVGKINK